MEKLDFDKMKKA